MDGAVRLSEMLLFALPWVYFAIRFVGAARDDVE